MNGILDTLASFPSALIGAVAGALGGILGVFLQHFLHKWTPIKSKIFGVALVVIPIITFPRIVDLWLSQRALALEAIKTENQLMQIDLFKVVDEVDPGFRDALRTKLRNALQSGEASSAVLGRLRSELHARFSALLVRLAPYASQEAVRDAMKIDYDTISALAAHPRDCVAYYMNEPTFDVALIPKDLQDRTLATKARMIREGVVRAVPEFAPLSAEDAPELLFKLLAETGTTLDQKLAEVIQDPKRDPVAGCAAATAVFKALAMGNAEQAVKFFKFSFANLGK